MKTEAVIDRFEGDKAVLMIEHDSKKAVVPRECLPSDAEEGDYLTVTIAVDEEKTRLARQEAERLFADIMQNHTK